MDEENPLVLVSDASQLNDLNEFMADPDIEEALDLVVKFIAATRLPEPVKAAALVLKLQGLSAKFAVQAVIYTTIKKDRAGSDNNHRKNVYYTMSEHMDKLAAAMKIVARANQL